MKKIGIGIIGAGRIGKLHAKSITYHIPEAEIAIISDPVIDVAKAVAGELSIPQYVADYKEVLKCPNVDAVLICSPTDTHADIAIEAARLGKHIFCEKPVDREIEKIVETKKVVEACKVKMQIGFNRRFDHNHKRVRDLAKSGVLGDIHVVKITSRDPEPPPAAYVRVSGGLFLDMAIHDFDMARFQSGSEVEEVFACGAVLVDPAIGKEGDIDTAIVTLKFKNGALGVIDNSRKAVYGYDQRVEVFGSKGMASGENDCPTTVRVSTAAEVSSDKPQYFFLQRYMESFVDEMKAFIDAVRRDAPVPVGIDDGLKPVVIAKAALKSLRENRPVRCDEIYRF
ncbi:MAG: inositol 2-dehydrogenase [Zoogloeaceae bacterium]|jgi:myo-inositol 2-dehydrogenase/D-chiro-inositol 1-dehydrogenase|nr:inositol 2-dehydrogenase [Zoogloeaceae bacterium]